MGADISDIPLDLVENILLRLEPRILLGLSRVCKDWSYLISSRQFWMRKLSCSGITNLPQRVLFNDCLDWRFYYLLSCQSSSYGRLSLDCNILQNGSGELETEESVLLQGNRNQEDFDSSWFRSWKTLSSGGDGWRLFPVSQGGGYFATSYHSCTKEQIICLADHGISPYLMDRYQPHIEMEELYSKHSHHAACYELQGFLMDESGNVIGEPFTFRDNMEAEEDDQWRKVSHTWTDYGLGVRLVKFYHGGMAESMEEGWLGAKMKGAGVVVRYPDRIRVSVSVLD